MSAYTGFLIRKTRLEKNLSQEGLAKGICATSYLSKIEQGLVEPGQDIIDRLFVALGIDFVRDPALEEEAKRQLEQFFFLYEAQQPYDRQTEFFRANGVRLERSEFALTYRVYCLCDAAEQCRVDEAKRLCAQLEPFLHSLPTSLKQRAIYAMADVADTLPESMQLLEQAALLGSSCVVTMGQAMCAHRMGKYGRSMELAERAYTMACEEGNPSVMIRSCFLMGTNACNRYDLKLAERYYNKAIALTRGYHWDVDHYATYNLGATYLEMGREEEAFAYLSRAHTVETDPHHNMLLCQKLAILCIGRGEREIARTHLDNAHAYFEQAKKNSDYRHDLYETMLRFTELLFCENVMDIPEYEAVLLQLYHETDEAFSHGFAQYYGRYLIDLYKHQRKYKEALRIREQIDVFS